MNQGVEQIAVPVWWLKQVRECLQGPLPTGRLGDVAFILRDQIGDLLANRPIEIWNPLKTAKCEDRGPRTEDR